MKSKNYDPRESKTASWLPDPQEGASYEIMRAFDSKISVPNSALINDPAPTCTMKKSPNGEGILP